ncbi:hypothetical protein V5P93_007122 [Actinokineospora auranticolor]|uniref:hypothetical protein n=1 Tax=Actinokineospora auranticolor TaxID=155976 RepID=UPI001FECCCAE|nr:hypothetical protein [Actinokineospora auranticolor]
MRVLGALVLALTVAGCTTTVAGSPVASISSSPQDRDLITRYFTEFNESGDEGVSTQRMFQRDTEHPDFTAGGCDLGNLVLHIEPALSTLRLDLKWKPDGAKKRPRGSVYVVGVSVRIRQGGVTLAEQIGSQRLVVLDGKVYGFTPCPTR